jgi:hypothetical protein
MRKLEHETAAPYPTDESDEERGFVAPYPALMTPRA